MNNQIELEIINDSDNQFYDLNGICENADSIFWTLVPNEMLSLWNLPLKIYNCYTNADADSVVNKLANTDF